MKVHKKPVRKIIQPDLRPDLNPLDYTKWGVLENKTIANSHPNIGSLKTAIKEEWNKIPKEFILKTCKFFWRCVDTIIEKMMAILSKFTVLCLLVLLFIF